MVTGRGQSNPNDWLPTGAPQQADALNFTNLPTSAPPPMDVQGNALAGDTVSIGFTNGTTKLSHYAVMMASDFRAAVTFTVSQNSTLNLSTEDDFEAPQTAVNTSGNDKVH